MPCAIGRRQHAHSARRAACCEQWLWQFGSHSHCAIRFVLGEHEACELCRQHKLDEPVAAFTVRSDDALATL
eukprot:4443983-Pleurochrysis_carterae.AAC.1